MLIERTLSSISSQDYPLIQHIVVDGCSEDDTLHKVRLLSPTSLIISEKDQGIYDAMNKGLRAATGDYVIFLNAGDEFYDNRTLSASVAKKPDADVYYGNTLVVNEAGISLADRRLSPPESLNWKSFRFGMCVSHQSIIARRKLCPFYNLSYKISSDIDWSIRLLKNAKHVVNTQAYISKFLQGGTSAKRRRQGLKERWQIMVEHYGLVQTALNHVFILLRFIWHRFTRKSMT